MFAEQRTAAHEYRGIPPGLLPRCNNQRDPVWTIDDEHLTKPIYLCVDFSVEVEGIRTKFAELVTDDPLHDGHAEPKVEVTDVKHDHIVLRCLAPAANPSNALHCRIREAMIAFLNEHPMQSLPRERVQTLDEMGTAELSAD